jgi:hypothetical protein
MYLTAKQLSELTDLRPNQRAAIRRWLTARGWVFTTSATGKSPRSYLAAFSFFQLRRARRHLSTVATARKSVNQRVKTSRARRCGE